MKRNPMHYLLPLVVVPSLIYGADERAVEEREASIPNLYDQTQDDERNGAQEQRTGCSACRQRGREDEREAREEERAQNFKRRFQSNDNDL